MESIPEAHMNQTERKLVLIEYSKIVLKRIEGETALTEEDRVRMGEIQTLLSLDHNAILQEAQEYLSGTVTP